MKKPRKSRRSENEDIEMLEQSLRTRDCTHMDLIFRGIAPVSSLGRGPVDQLM